jgi:hypothetical protein
MNSIRLHPNFRFYKASHAGKNARNQDLGDKAVLKIIAAIRRRPGMTHAEFVDYVVRVHGQLARDNPLKLQRYVQSHVYDGAFGSYPAQEHSAVFHRDSVTELYFASPKDMAETFADEYNRTVIAPDGAQFAELATNQTALTHETVLVPPTIGGAGTKIMQFLVASSSSASGIGAAQSGWQAAHDSALAAAPLFSEVLAGSTRSDVVADAGDKAADAHFGGGARAPLALIASLWAPDGAVGAFRDYERALFQSDLYDRERSYFLFTREIEILSIER